MVRTYTLTSDGHYQLLHSSEVSTIIAGAQSSSVTQWQVSQGDLAAICWPAAASINYGADPTCPRVQQFTRGTSDAVGSVVAASSLTFSDSRCYAFNLRASTCAACVTCPAGSVANDVQTACLPCPAGAVSSVGSNCTVCTQPLVPNADASQCIKSAESSSTGLSSDRSRGPSCSSTGAAAGVTGSGVCLCICGQSHATVAMLACATAVGLDCTCESLPSSFCSAATVGTCYASEVAAAAALAGGTQLDAFESSSSSPRLVIVCAVLGSVLLLLLAAAAAVMIRQRRQRQTAAQSQVIELSPTATDCENVRPEGQVE